MVCVMVDLVINSSYMSCSYGTSRAFHVVTADASYRISQDMSFHLSSHIMLIRLLPTRPTDATSA